MYVFSHWHGVAWSLFHLQLVLTSLNHVQEIRQSLDGWDWAVTATPLMTDT